MQMPRQLSELGFMLLWFALACGTAVATIHSVVATVPGVFMPSSRPADIVWFLVAFAIATLAFITVLKVFRGRWFLEALTALSLWFGLTLVFEQALTGPQAGIFAAVIVALRLVVPILVLSQTILGIGVGGIAAYLALSFSVWHAAVLLAVLAVYDIIAVFKTKHMVTLAREVIQRKAPLFFVLPGRPAAAFRSLTDITPGEGARLLGTGDIALPAFFLAAASLESTARLVGASIGLAVGIVALWWWSQAKRPLPGLPPLVAGTLIGYAISFLAT